MIPLRLSIQGLYSYQQKQEIDFRYLTDAHLFGIFGATGSGKSSILEAITFALYGQSERLNQRENRGYNMMNLRSDRLHIEFGFESGGKEYLFVVSGRRNTQRFDDVKTFERQAYEIKEGSPSPLPHASAEEILGLSYDNFRRTIIIPQGQFQEFLQLTETERTRMLREIFYLGKFELSNRVGSLERKTNIRIAQTDSLLGQYQQISSEILTEKQTQVSQIVARSEKLNQELKQQQQRLQQLEILQQLFAELTQQKNLFAQYQQQLPEIQAREQQIQAYELCLRDFKPLLDRKLELQQEQQRIQTESSQKQSSHQAGQADLEKKVNAQQQLEATYQQRDEWNQRAREIRTVVQLKKWGENVAALNQRLANGEGKINSLQDEIQDLRQQSHAQESNIQQLRENQPLLDRLLPIRDWFDKKTLLQQELEKAQKEETDLQNQQIDLQRQQQQLLSGTSLAASQADLPIVQLLELLSQRQQSVEQDLAHQRTQFHQVQAQQELQRFADELVNGEPCPLCGSVHHPEPMSAEDLTDLRIRLEDQIQQLTSAQQKNAQALAKLEALSGQQQHLQAQLAKRNQEVQAIQARVDAHQQAFRWEGGYSAEKVQAEIRSISLTSRQIEVLVKEKEALEKTLVDKEKTLKTYQDALTKLQQQQQQEAIQFEAGKKALRYVKFESHLNESDASIEELALEYESQYRSIETMYQQGEARIRTLRSTQDALQGEIKSLGEREKELYKRLAAQNQALDIRLTESPFESLKEIEQILDQVLDIEREKQRTREFHQNLHATEVSIKTLTAKTEGKSFDEGGFEELKTLIANLEQQASELMVEHGSLQREIERLQADLEHKAELTATRKQLQDRIDNLSILRKMFHRSGFVNFVSTIYLENLCRAANERFQRLTRGSLSLETTASNSFQVRDFLNDGQLRSVKTLSGGQTFQASLSLALALADQVQQQARNPQNFFFLDEGFGSQDKNSLQVIFQTLKSLRKENRIVGIISHVEELQQEIDAHLKVSNDPQRGSQVQGSWE